ncbi:hypothetical protein M409DRAFT_51822 [Zasmidium cellare ATCC 36951]|uniref:Uncharacterized protein n=1 Tax=Zasmidium cellare ATCC 36951 TaxID=1080233 RepID=A0A6A6CW62_ZASCE|nr:uncharacterized protein M409DRAFT_51822 [Zasmidium cellare ATCC 36951]KAF2170052.1 hypothetical protein M409DRAFT_51822 [Zasmidium cellare ATCC 36951]
MLTCPPSRINLTSADLASFDRRWVARQSARRDADNVRLGQGPARQTRLAFVPAAANAGRHRADSCSSQATVHATEDDDPALHSNTASPAGRLDLPSLGDKSNSSNSATTRQGVPSPQKPIHDESTPGPARSPSKPPPELDFPIYEDPPLLQALVEARHFQQHNNGSRFELNRSRPVTSNLQQRAVAAPPVIHQLQIPTLLYPPLDPGAPVFVPRTRFGSTTSLSDQSSGVVIESSTTTGQIEQSTANLRIRSSFERNTQHSSRSAERHSVISDSSISLVPSDGPQARRRSRNNDQNTALHRPLLGFDRYPAVRPPAVAFASRRNSGSQRQVVFPRRRSSRQHLVEFERSRRSQEARQQNRSSTHLTVPGNNGRRPVSPAASTSSRSTPNLLQPPSAPYIHVRSSSLSSNRSGTQHVGHVPARRARKSGATVSEPSGLIDDLFLQRDSPLDRIIQKYAKYSTRPRSVGRSFERPPGRRTRPSLLSGDLFTQDPTDDLEDYDHVEKNEIASQPLMRHVGGRTTVERPLTSSPISPKSDTWTLHKRHPTIEDPVALALALPSPEVPSSPLPRSSPVVRSSPQLPSTPILRSGPSRLLSPEASTSSAAKSAHSTGSLTPSVQSLAAAVTPRVPVYNDSHPTTQQPQTPADIAKSTRRARGRSNTTSTHQATPSAVHPSPTLAPPERHPHRHTFPSSTSQQTPEVTVGMTPVRAAAVMETTSAVRHDSVLARVQQRSSNSSENDIEGNLDGLEQDRRVWM